MCGRFVQGEELLQFIKNLPFDIQGVPFSPNYNTSPTDLIWAFTFFNGNWHGFRASWGLVPHWSKEAGDSMANIHHRMPVAVKDSNLDSWCKQGQLEEAINYSKSLDIEVGEVSKDINNSRNTFSEVPFV